MDALSDDCLILIFKFLDLRSRLAVAKTCKQWRRLVSDSSTLMDDVSEVYLNKWKPDQENSEVPSILEVFSHVKNCRQLKLGVGVGHGFLLEQRLKDEMERFEKVVLMPKRYDNDIVVCLQLLPSSVKRLQVVGCWVKQFALNLSDSVRLEALDLAFLIFGEEANSFDPPSTLTRYRFENSCNYVPEVGETHPIEPTDYFLRNRRVGPLLSELNLYGLDFYNKSFSSLLSIIRDGAPNLHRISFQVVVFEFEDTKADALIKEFSTNDGRLLPFKWIKIESCFGGWLNDPFHLQRGIAIMLEVLLSISNVETLVIHFRDESPHGELSALYKLTPLIKKKGTKLELTINSVDQPRDLEDILVPSELSGVLTKIDLVNVHHTQLLQVMLNDDDSFNLLTEIRLEECICLGDATLEVVAKWCKNLKKLKFKPHHCLGLHVVTDQCLVPFLSHWNDRKSAQLLIECLQPAHPFGGFNLPIDQEKGDFQDGKKWMVFRKACLLDGCDRLGTRLVIWDQFQKSMIITDYQRNFDHQVKISVMDGNCILKEKKGMEFEADKDY